MRLPCKTEVEGAKALLIGVVAILIAGHIGSYSKTYFDGVLDTHSGASAPQWFFLAAGIIDWLCMGAIFWTIGKIVVEKPFRADRTSIFFRCLESFAA